MKNLLVNLMIWSAIAAFVALVIALAMGAQYACHRWVGPWMTNGDPTAVAIYCKPHR